MTRHLAWDRLARILAAAQGHDPRTGRRILTGTQTPPRLEWNERAHRWVAYCGPDLNNQPNNQGETK